MNAFKIYIVTECGHNFGFGHLTRCLSLYRAFKARGKRPIFVINSSVKCKNILMGARFFAFDWHKNPEKLLKIIRGSDLVIIDSYFADLKLCKAILDNVKHAVFLDDNKRISYPGGIVLNPANYAKTLIYPKSKNIKYLLGTKYSLIRKEFWNSPQKKIRKNIKELLLMFGGSDKCGLTPKALKLVIKMFPDSKKNVVIGSGTKSGLIKKVSSIADSNTRVFLDPKAGMLRLIMLRSDLAISSAGQTLNELAILGIPAISISVAQNQVRNAIAYDKTGAIKYAGAYFDKNTFSLLTEYLYLLKNARARLRLSNKGRKMFSGGGPGVLVQEILDYLKHEKN